MVEMGEPLTVQSLKDVYSKLLRDYFGPGFVIDEELALECLRIPHFYRAFYVYQYATGLSAAIALSERILQGGSSEQSSMLDFLKAGCARFPLEILRDAGVDMAGGEPVDLALCGFARWVSELETLI
jgi:oligoendopeptidase F